jgi:hypothetical protein
MGHHDDFLLLILANIHLHLFFFSVIGFDYMLNMHRYHAQKQDCHYRFFQSLSI